MTDQGRPPLIRRRTCLLATSARAIHVELTVPVIRSVDRLPSRTIVRGQSVLTDECFRCLRPDWERSESEDTEEFKHHDYLSFSTVGRIKRSVTTRGRFLCSVEDTLLVCPARYKPQSHKQPRTSSGTGRNLGIALPPWLELFRRQHRQQ